MNPHELHRLLRGISLTLLIIIAGWLVSDTAFASQLKHFLINSDLLVDHAVSNTRLRGQIGGGTNTVFAVNGKAYIGEGVRLTVLDVSNPAQPTVLGKGLPFPDIVQGIFVEGSRAYVAAGFSGLHIIDVTNPANPVEVGSYDSPGDAVGVYVVGATAYLADSQSGLRVVNVSNPASPAELSFYDTPGEARGVTVVGSIAYVADGASGLRLINVANLASLTEIGFYDTPGEARGVTVFGAIAYVADRFSGLRVVDASNPAKPSEVGFFNTFGEALRVTLLGTTAYVADGFSGLEIVNIANSANPTALGSFNEGGEVRDLVVIGATAYLANKRIGLRMLDVANPASLNKLGIYHSLGALAGIAVANGMAYLADGYSGLQIVNIANPDRPEVVGVFNAPAYVVGVYVVGTTAYLANYSRGLRIIDASNPANPVEIGFFSPSDTIYGVYVVGNLAYLAGSTGLYIINLVDPANPTQLGFFAASGSSDVQVIGTTAYVASYSGLRLVNVSNPTSPTGLGFYATGNGAASVVVVGAQAYVTTGYGGLQIINVANPASPFAVGSYDTPDYAAGVRLLGNTAYVADGYSGLRVLNVTNAANPVEIGFYDTPGYAADLALVGNTAYVASDFGGLWLLQSPPCYQLRLQHTGSGSNPLATPANSPNCPAGTYLFGELISLSAAPDPDWRIANWQGSNNDNTTSKNNTLTMPAADQELTVNYTACYPLNLNHSGLGAVPVATPTNSNGCASGRYSFGELISLSAAPASDWHITTWIGTNNDPTTSANNVLTMPAAPHAVIVNYATACFALTVQHSGDGSDPVSSPANSPTCPSGQYIAGEKVNLHATPATGWRVGQWVGASAPNTSTDNQFVMPAQPHTINVTYAALPTTAAGDAYEADDTCAQAHQLNADGVNQTHTFHRPGDEDWLQFAGVAQTPYRLEVSIPAGSPADVVLEVYAECTGTAVSKFDQSFAPGVRLDMTPTTTAPLYLRLHNVDATVGGANMSYQVSARTVTPVKAAANENQALILVGGSYSNPDRLQKNISYVTDAVYAYFRTSGYKPAAITYLSNDPAVVNRTGAATQAALQTAITEWARQRLTVGGQLTLYLMDHGDEDKFYLDNAHDQVLTPKLLDGWLSQLESVLPELKVTVIIEACHAGSFINGEQSISKGRPGRVVLTSTNDTLLAYASANGAYFSDFILASLQQGYNLPNSFKATYGSVRELSTLLQEPWLDGNGNGIPNEPADVILATQHNTDNEAQGWAPYIVSVQPFTVVNRRGILQAVVRDDKKVRRVWAVITPPSYRPPQQSSELVAESLPTIVLNAQGNDTFAAEYPGFDELGLYRIAVYAEDEENLIAQPKVIALNNGSKVFLPTVTR